MKFNKAMPILNKEQYINNYETPIKFVAYSIVVFSIYLYAHEIIIGGDSFKTGDWLINYNGGFVRRGLVGHVLYSLTWSSNSLLWAAFILQASIQLLVIHYVFKLFFSAKLELSWLIVIFSPAFIILFPFYGPNGSFRKETIFFLSFCLLANGLRGWHFKQKYLVASLLVYAIAVFSHEVSALVLVFFLYLLYGSASRNKNIKSSAWLYAGGYIAVASSGFVLSILYPGSDAVSGSICQSLVVRGLYPDICEGAIDWLRYDAGYALSETAKILPRNVYYLQALFLALIPLLLSDWWRSRLFLLSIGFLSILPLFALALDWGRWIHIYIVMVFVVLLFDACDKDIKMHRISLAVVVAYCCLWSMPHYLDIGERVPELGMLKFAYLVYGKLMSF